MCVHTCKQGFSEQLQNLTTRGKHGKKKKGPTSAEEPHGWTSLLVRRAALIFLAWPTDGLERTDLRGQEGAQAFANNERGNREALFLAFIWGGGPRSERLAHSIGRSSSVGKKQCLHTKRGRRDAHRAIAQLHVPKVQRNERPSQLDPPFCKVGTNIFPNWKNYGFLKNSAWKGTFMQTFLNTLANYWACWAVEDQTKDSKVSEGIMTRVKHSTWTPWA